MKPCTMLRACVCMTNLHVGWRRRRGKTRHAHAVSHHSTFILLICTDFQLKKPGKRQGTGAPWIHHGDVTPGGAHAADTATLGSRHCIWEAARRGAEQEPHGSMGM